uniref:Uncharacterized protein n=1 Tax=Anguilla anguilla TaxID=7936 RepID=A0A0E9UKT0_ANGAN
MRWVMPTENILFNSRFI